MKWEKPWILFGGNTTKIHLNFNAITSLWLRNLNRDLLNTKVYYFLNTDIRLTNQTMNTITN